MMYLDGDGVKKNRDKAIDLLRKSALQGNEEADARLRRLGY